MSLPTRSSATANMSTSTALVVAKQEERLLSDEMGTAIVSIHVGQEKQVFTIHKNLLCATGSFFQKLFNTPSKAGQIYHIPHVDAGTFQLLVHFLYTKRIPVAGGTDLLAHGVRLRHLCMLYAFADNLSLDRTFRNRVMDAIQNGFAAFGRCMEPGIVEQVYKFTTANSKLRKFCAASLVHRLHSGSTDIKEDRSLQTLLSTNAEIMDDFLAVVREQTDVGRDPRYRDCGGDEHCAECTAGYEGKHGFWP